MQAPDLADLIDREERAVVQRRRADWCVNEWRYVKRWLNECPSDIPVFVSNVFSEINRSTVDQGTRTRMMNMLNALYPEKELSDAWGDKAYRYSRLYGIISRFITDGESL